MNEIRCRVCGKRIRMIKTAKGKTIPCNPWEVEFVPDVNGPDKYVIQSEDGSWFAIRGCEPMEGDTDIHTGMKDHRNGCKKPSGGG